MSVLADIRFGARLLAKDPAFTLAVAGMIGLGIGVNSMMFTIYSAALLKSPRFENPGEVVHVHSRNPTEGWEDRGFAFQRFLDYREQSRSLKDVGAYMEADYRLTEKDGTVRRTPGCLVSAGLFSMLGLRPALGRNFRDEDAWPSSPPVVMVSHTLWQLQFGGDRDIVGRQLRLDGVPRTIIGVMGEGVSFPRMARLWVPAVDTEQNRDSWSLRFGFFLVGRLGASTGRLQAETELRAITARIEVDEPRRSHGTQPVVLPFADWGIRPRDHVMARTALGAVTFVLLIACANVANLLLSRAARRQREVSIRFAVGATRMRIVRQLLVESVLLSLGGGVLGLALALVLIRAFVIAISPLGPPSWIDWSMDATSFAHLAASCLASGILLGLAPALQVSEARVIEGLQASARQSSGGRRGPSFAGFLVAAEIALTLILMVGAGLMVRSLIAMQTIDLGVDARRLLTTTLPLDETKYPEPAHRIAFVERLAEKLTPSPEVESFTVTSVLPGSGASQVSFVVDGAQAAGAEPPLVASVTIGDGYFEAVGLSMVRGHEFTPRDSQPGTEGVIVNQRFAARHWPSQNPVGRRIRLGQGPWREVRGVSPDIRQTSLRGDQDPVAYLPLRQAPPYHFNAIVRVRRGTAGVAQAVRAAFLELDPDLAVPDVEPLEATLGELSRETRILGTLFSLFACIGVFLSAVGIYSVTAYATSQRTRDIGIRIALGATQADIVRLILRSGVAQLVAALAVGLPGAVALSRVFESVLFEVSPLDPMTFLAVPLGLSAVVLVACWIPARRASRLHPTDAIRVE